MPNIHSWHAGTDHIPGNSITRHRFRIFSHLDAADERFRKYFNCPISETLIMHRIQCQVMKKKKRNQNEFGITFEIEGHGTWVHFGLTLPGLTPPLESN